MDEVHALAPLGGDRFPRRKPQDNGKAGENGQIKYRI